MAVAVYQQHSVAGRNSEQGYESYYGRYAHDRGTYPYGKHSAYQGQRQAGKHNGRQTQVAELGIQEQEDYEYREYRSQGEGAGRICRALELSPVLDAVAFWQGDFPSDHFFDFFNHASHIPSAHIGAHYSLAPYVLPADGSGASGGHYVRNLSECDLAAGSGVDKHVGHIICA